MIEIAKWILFDSDKKNNKRFLRFDELTKIIQEGDIYGSDLIQSPNETSFMPVKYCSALNYYLLKRRQHETMHPEESRDQAAVNKRIFRDIVMDPSSKEHNQMKNMLFHKFQKQVTLLLDDEETILYLALPFGNKMKPGTSDNEKSMKVKKGRMLVVFTDKRVLRLSFDEEMKYLADIKFYLYEKFDTFYWRDDFFHNKSLNILLAGEELIHWKGLKSYEIEKIDIFLFTYIEWNKKIKEKGIPDFLKDTRTVNIDAEILFDEEPEAVMVNKEAKETPPEKEPELDLSNDAWRISFELFMLAVLFFTAVKYHLEHYTLVLVILAVVFFIELFLAKVFFMHQQT